MLEIVRRPAAITDLIEASEYLEKAAGGYIADRFLILAQDAMSKLADMPGIGSPRPHPQYPALRMWQIRPHPHLILYSATDTTLEILRVIHGERDIKTILSLPYPFDIE